MRERPTADTFVRRGGQYEYREVRIPRTTSPADAHRMLSDEAEHGRWELARTRLYAGGERRVWLRRKIYRVAATL
jgi:hypothetical protein